MKRYTLTIETKADISEPYRLECDDESDVLHFDSIGSVRRDNERIGRWTWTEEEIPNDG